MQSKFLNEEGKWTKCRIISVRNNCAYVKFNKFRREVILDQLPPKDVIKFLLDENDTVEFKGKTYTITSHARERAFERFSNKTPNAFIRAALQSKDVEEIKNINRVREFMKYGENCRVIFSVSRNLIAILVNNEVRTVYKYSTSKFKGKR